MVLTLILILAGGLGSALSYAVIYDTQVKITQAQRELTNQREVNTAIRTEITQRYTLNEVEWIALNRLGMNRPDASQIIYIHVPKQSHVVLHNEDEIFNVEYSFITGLTDLVRDTINRLTGRN
jgi:cell division protein FtsL